MPKSQDLFSLMKENRLVALLTPNNPSQCLKAYEIFQPLGIVLEIAFRSPAALEGVAAIVEKHPDALLLTGTVITPQQAEAAIAAGAAGIVSPDYLTAVVETCVARDVMCIPGGLSDAGKQLARKAALYGFTLDELRERRPCQWIYKLFPAFAGGKSNADLAQAWKGPYRGLTIVYTGGVDAGNLRELTRKDPDGIFCGSALAQQIDNPEKARNEVELWKSALRVPEKEETAPPIFVPQPSPSKPVVVTFGEIMLRLSPPNHQRFLQAHSFKACFGGAEANVAAALANYGLKSRYITALPDNEIGNAAMNALSAFGVDTSFILRRGKRLGIYFLEAGASQRPSKVIYDRAGSAFSEIESGQIEWDEIFNDARWFHWSGITPALSDSAAGTTLEALKTAKKAGLTVSVDLNYRKKLWTKEKAQETMTPLMEYVDICFGNEEDADSVFGIKAPGAKIESGALEPSAYKEVARSLVDKFGIQKTALTLRQSRSASLNQSSACLYNGAEFLLSESYLIHIIDRVGGGDSFASGFIYALLIGKSDREALEFAAAASCLKQTIPGDFNLVTVEEVERLASGAKGGRIQR